MQNGPRQLWVQLLHDEVQGLPRAAVPMAAALVRDEVELPLALRELLLLELGQRADLRVVSPAAQAVLRLRQFYRYAELEPVLQEMEAHYTLLRALGLVETMYTALDFLSRLAEYAEGAVQPGEDTSSSL